MKSLYSFGCPTLRDTDESAPLGGMGGPTESDDRGVNLEQFYDLTFLNHFFKGEIVVQP